MPHVTFIHGIANKPEEDALRRIWLQALEDAVDPLSLTNEGVTTSMVYWADLMYPNPIADTSSFESADANADASSDGDGGAEAPVSRNPDESAFLDKLRASMPGLADDDTAGEVAGAANIAAAATLERIPLPWFVKKPIMNALLRDVHHYLFDVRFSPSGGAAVPIQQTIRKRFVDKLCNVNADGAHVVVSHSMGTVIAYDCLKRVPECAKVDGLITIGSPLGLDEIQDKLQPGWTRDGGYPSDRVAKRWVNLYDRLDPVCGLDPELANDYRFDGGPRIEDIRIENEGVWRHSATKYLKHAKFVGALRSMLEL